MFKTTMSRPVFDEEGLTQLGARWRALAARSNGSYFQDWGWVGCMAAERYPDPILLEVEHRGTLVGLALFDGQGSRRDSAAWFLHESSDPAQKSIFVEHNGPVLAITDSVLRQAVLAELFSQAMRGPVDGCSIRPRRLVLSGIGPEFADALTLTGGLVDVRAVRVAPYARLQAPHENRPFIERLSRNTRHQLRRSNRLYEADGPLRVRRAETVEEGAHFFAEMIVFHDATWKARGKSGAFATPFARRFYETLFASGIASGEVDLLQITAGDNVVGYLMNFVYKNVVSAYQSGFNYSAASPHQKPGLTSHYMAIEVYRERGIDDYDFLGGGDRYKLSLANAQRWLHWVSVSPAWHRSWLGVRVRSLMRL